MACKKLKLIYFSKGKHEKKKEKKVCSAKVV